MTDFAAVPDRAPRGRSPGRVRDGRLRTVIGDVSTRDAVAAFDPPERITGKTIISMRP